MKYICLVYQDIKKLEDASEGELAAVIEGCGSWIRELERTGRHVFSSGLQSILNAATVRKSNGHVSVTDGPFAETKEHLAGFTILNVGDLNEAIQLVAKLPAVCLGSVEVRPIFDVDAPLMDPIDQKLASAMRRSAQDAALWLTGQP